MRKKYFFPITALIALITPLIFPFFTHTAYATVTTDHQNGLYADDFSDNTGVPTRSYVNVNTAQGVLQLTNTASQTSFTPPYRTSGNARTTALRPLLVAQWGTLSVDATIPQGTTLKVQVMDRNSKLWPDYILAGNSGGIDISETSEIDLSVMPYLEYCSNIWDTTCADPRSIRINILMTTEDTNITPTIDNLSFDWSPRQGTFQETVSISEDDPWPVTGGNQQTTNSTPYFNSETYPAFRWMSERISGDPYTANLFSRKDAIVGHMFNSEGRLFSLNRDTGKENWQIPAVYLGGGFIDSEGVYYSDNMNVDYSQAIDTNTGEVKWVYFSGTHGAHGGQNVALGNNGKLYYTRDNASSVNTTLVEQSPNGTIESTTVLNVVPEGLASGESKSVSPMRIGPDGRGYVVVSVTKSGSFVDKGGLWAINLEEKTIEQIYSGRIDSKITIGNDGTIYMIFPIDMSFDWTTFSFTILPSPIKILAIRPDGTIKWERDAGIHTELGYAKIILREDGNLLAKRDIADGKTYATAVMEVIDSATGEVLQIKESSYSDRLGFSDGKNGYYLQNSSTFEFVSGELVKFDVVEEQFRYIDANGALKWEIPYAYISRPEGPEGKKEQYEFSKAIPDERGWVYVGFNKGVVIYDDPDCTTMCSTTRFIDESFAKVFALAPWTLTDLSDITGAKQAGDTIDFRVKTSMQETNPVFDGENAMQVIMENGDKILLSYSSTDENSDTIWTGSYILPESLTSTETVTYSIEASQSYLQTDIETHFDSAPTESNNTGIRLAGSFTIQFPSQTPPQNENQNQTQNESQSQTPPLQKDTWTTDTKDSLSFSDTNYLNKKDPTLTGKNESSKKGTVTLYTKTKKGGTKKLSTHPIDEQGKWDIDIKQKNNKEQSYALSFTNEQGISSDISSFFSLSIDSDKPRFVEPLPQTTTRDPQESISFLASDETTEITHYQVQLYNQQGKVVRKWRKQNDPFYFLPDSLPLGIYTLHIRAYDKAGNKQESQVTIDFSKKEEEGGQEQENQEIQKAQQLQQTPQTPPSQSEKEEEEKEEQSRNDENVNQNQNQNQNENLNQNPTPPTSTTQKQQLQKDSSASSTCSKRWWNPFTWKC